MSECGDFAELGPIGTGPVRIMIVDDDPGLRSLVGGFLRDHGIEVSEAQDAVEMRRRLAAAEIDVLVLDVMIPGEDGLSIARSLGGATLGIIMVSALGRETDRIHGLEAGADDYLPKPFSPPELLARINALIRRQRRAGRPSSAGQFAFAGWTLDAVRRTLRDRDGVIVSLSEGEMGLLLAFVEHPGVVLSRDMLLELSRGDDSDAFDRAVDTQVSRLRRKLATRVGGEIVRTVRSEGYVFLPTVSRS